MCLFTQAALAMRCAAARSNNETSLVHSRHSSRIWAATVRVYYGGGASNWFITFGDGAAADIECRRGPMKSTGASYISIVYIFIQKTPLLPCAESCARYNRLEMIASWKTRLAAKTISFNQV